MALLGEKVTAGLPLTLVGASVRAAAFSAIRAGFRPSCVDLFADTDLTAVATARRIAPANYPGRLPAETEFLSGPIVYTGALENHPDVIDEMASIRPLWGNGSSVLRLCRDPFWIAETLLEHHLPALKVSKRRSGVDGMAVRKPIDSAGGTRIRLAPGDEGSADRLYYQQFVGGFAYSAAYAALGDSCVLLGATQQFTGDAAFNAAPFHYCGSIGPIELSVQVRATLEKWGELLRQAAGLRGLFGIDFGFDDGVPRLLEVNPRYSASMEVLEYATGARFFEWHRAAFDADAEVTGHPRRRQTVAKAIVFAEDRFTFPDVCLLDPGATNDSEVSCADVPAKGEIIERGMPILTVFAAADTMEDCRRRLYERVLRLRRKMRDPG